MTESLCGRSHCGHLCSRVCHCPAGMERIHYLWLLRRVERGQYLKPATTPPVSSLKPDPISRPCPLGVNPMTGEILEVGHGACSLNQPQHKKPSRHLPTHSYRQAAPPFGRVLKPVTVWAFLAGFLVFMTLVLTFGLIAGSGTLIHPTREDQKRVYQDDGLTLKEKYGDEWVERNKWMWED